MNPIGPKSEKFLHKSEIRPPKKQKSKASQIAKKGLKSFEPSHAADLPRAPLITKKAKETESIQDKRLFPLIRQNSERVLGKNELSEAQELSNRTGEMWDCVGRHLDKFGSYIYDFKLQNQHNLYPLELKLRDLKNSLETLPMTREGQFKKPAILNEIKEVEREISIKRTALYKKAIEVEPADEPYDYKLDRLQQILSFAESSHPHAFIINEIAQTFKALGYRLELNDKGAFLSLPDRETFISNWEELRRKDPRLPPLDVISSAGIATDLDFVETYASRDGLISSGKEFVHDHTAHIMNIVILALVIAKFPFAENIDFSHKNLRNQFAKVIIKDYQRLMIAKMAIEQAKLGNVIDPLFTIENLSLLEKSLQKIEFSLGALVDRLASVESPTALMENLQKSGNSILETELATIWQDSGFRSFADRRFPVETIEGKEPDQIALPQVWNQIIEFSENLAKKRDH